MINFVKGIINVFLCHIFYRVKYINLDVIKNLDKCILCPNHSNTVEPAWLYAKMDNACIMAKAELFRNKIIARVLTYFGVFPINRGEKDVRSLLHSINLFRNAQKRKLVIFPEGRRLKKEENRGIPKVGPFYIAYKAHVPIVPVYITKNVKLFSKVNIIYGEPVYITKEIGSDKVALKHYAEDILNNIYDMGKTIQNKNLT